MRPARALAWLALALLLPAGASRAVEGDLVIPRREGQPQGTPPAFFPHWIHRIHFRCYVCHDAIFQMKGGANPITMDAIRAGKFCGACHDGKTAFPVGFETCGRCHRE